MPTLCIAVACRKASGMSVLPVFRIAVTDEERLKNCRST
jgi:hypothetical protein